MLQGPGALLNTYLRGAQWPRVTIIHSFVRMRKRVRPHARMGARIYFRTSSSYSQQSVWPPGIAPINAVAKGIEAAIGLGDARAQRLASWLRLMARHRSGGAGPRLQPGWRRGHVSTDGATLLELYGNATRAPTGPPQLAGLDGGR